MKREFILEITTDNKTFIHSSEEITITGPVDCYGISFIEVTLATKDGGVKYPYEKENSIRYVALKIVAINVTIKTYKEIEEEPKPEPKVPLRVRRRANIPIENYGKERK